MQNHPSVEIITPPYLLNSSGGDAVRPAILSSPSVFAPNGTITVTVDSSNAHSFVLMRLGSSTHTVNLDHRRVPLTIVSQSAATFTLQIPPNPIHVPPGYYWLFALNANGVPSIAVTLQRQFS